MTRDSNHYAGSALVLGGGGLLGSALFDCLESTDARVLGRGINLPWSSSHALRETLDAIITSFLREEPESPKFIYRAAGVSNLRSGSEEVKADAECLKVLLETIDDVMRTIKTSTSLTFCFSSSAGGVYGKSGRPPFLEDSHPNPWSPYGESKLELEQHLLNWSSTRGIRCVIARITSLYGARQNMSKSQGILSRLLSNVAHRRPTRIFVPSQTTRNYIYVGDAAKLMVRHACSPFEAHRVANICSSYDSTLSNVIQTVKNVTKLRVPTQEGSDSRFSDETIDLRVRSHFQQLVDECCRTSLATGTKHLFDAEIARLSRGD
jgi:UDP-glucose 4-epimerase